MDLNFLEDLEDLEEDLPVSLMLQMLEREEIDPMNLNLMYNNLSTIELVLRANPILMTFDLYLSVFYQASKHNNISILRFLIEENNYIKRLGLSVEDLFITAICVKEVRILPYLLRALSQQGNISVHSLLLLSIRQACQSSSFKIVMFLINALPGDKREILEAKDNHRRTPLHFAVLQYQNQCLSLQSDISAPDTHDTWKLVEFLVNANVDINAQDSEGNTPIHHLFYDGCTRVLHLLVSHGGGN
jgi:ankyrin repeat protein